MREHYIRSLLTFSASESDDIYTFLIERMAIPVEWIHAAKAPSKQRPPATICARRCI